jgi:AcrR family transcriptional regulator
LSAGVPHEEYDALPVGGPPSCDRGAVPAGVSLAGNRVARRPISHELARSRIALQRERILRAMVEVVAERGYAGASVELVVGRAGVSRRTFYGCFESRKACFLALLDLGLERAVHTVGEAFEQKKTWQDGVRTALASLLVLLDSESLLAWVLLVESLAAGSWALRRRGRNLARLRDLVVSSWPITGSWSPPRLAADGAMASVLGVIHTHILFRKSAPLIELLGPLMGLVAAQYLPPRAVAREIERGEQLAREIQAARRHAPRSGVAIPALLSNPNAHRARRCMLFLAEHPQASNREVAAATGVAHQSQISTLLSCLLRERLVDKRSAGPGKRNSWRLTSHGEEISRALKSTEVGQISLNPAVNARLSRM